VKITKVEPIFADRFLFVRIETDKGYVGIGESGAWGHLEASGAAVEKFASYLVGKDPRTIEHHWNVMMRFSNFTGAATNGAISAIDIALWDIKGKWLGVPIYELLGGRVRDNARVYAHCKGRTSDKLAARAARLRSEGYTAVGCMNPFLDEGFEIPWNLSHIEKMHQGTDNVRRVREAVGPAIDICIEIHSRMNPAEAVTLGRALEPYTPMFLEDPIRPGSIDAMAWVADHIPIPVATGERYVTLYQFQTLISRRGAEYLRPCITLCGGITAGKKIAAMAEAHDIQIAFHNPLSPVNLTACLQLDACIPNFAIQEYPYDNADLEGIDGLRGSRAVPGLPAPENGFIAIPDRPGLGIELPEDIAKKYPRVDPGPVMMRPHADGFVVEE
jgi:galactonate dehydratase